MVTDYTTSVRSLAYSNIDQANMYQTPNGSSIRLTYIGLMASITTSRGMLDTIIIDHDYG